MGARFIIGRAGTGKTHHCLEAIRAALREDPIEGPRLILLVPEQTSLQMERAILQPADVPGAHRAEVLSFQRLAFKVLESTPGLKRTALSESARAMVLRYLLARHGAELVYYRRVERLRGFIDKLAVTITELIQEDVSPAELEAVERENEASAPDQSAKLHDVRLIYAAYLDYLGADRLDPSQYLQLARERLPQCAWVAGADVWVDGFASLSGQEMLTLVALAHLARHLDITVLTDPGLDGPASGGSPTSIAAELFGKTQRTYLELQRALVNASVAVEEPLRLRPAPPPRFTHAPGLAQVERSLFAPPESKAMDIASPPAGLELIELPSRRIEVDYAVSRIMAWTRESKLRYREMAIIVRDLEVYHDLLSEALTARGIPSFIDRRRPIAHHPIVELLRSGLAMATDRLSLDAVRLALKTGLLPIDGGAIDELENFLLAHGIHGPEAWRGGDWAFLSRTSFVAEEGEPDERETERLARVNRTRHELLGRLDPWLTFAAAPKGHTGAAWSAAMVDWLNQLGVAETVAHWSDAAAAAGDADHAAEQAQIIRDLQAFLDDLAAAFGDMALTADELAQALEAGLSTLTLGLAPPMIDQVLVGSIERSRHPEIKAAVILGFNDGVFPHRPVEDSILNDDDRTLLHDRGVRIGPPTRTRVLEEELLVYVALTRPSERCVVTYAAVDDDGRTLRPSPYQDTLRQACPGLTVTRVGDPVQTGEMWDILSNSDLARRLLLEFRTRPPADRDDPARRGRWNGLYECNRAELRNDAGWRRAGAALDERREIHLSAACIQRAFGGPMRTSVSQLETYATCPFQYYARYILRLKEREEAALAPVDVGQLHHAVLEDFINTVATRGRSLAEISEAECLAELDNSAGRVASRLPADAKLTDARNAYVLRRCTSQLARIIRAQRRVSQAGTARPRAAEVAFGVDLPDSLPAVELTTPAGRSVRLRGFIDRVDLAEVGDDLLGVVIDYKHKREPRLKLAEVYHGLSLQLLGYLLALADLGETLAGRPIRPIAALYVGLRPKYEVVEHPDAPPSREAECEGVLRPRGVIRAEDFDALDPSIESGWSEHYSFYRKKDGKPGNLQATDAADAATFDALQRHTRWKLGELADAILDGDITVRPYRLGTFSPCSWCAMPGVCRFEMGINDVRFLESLKRLDVIARLGGASNQ